MSLILGAAMPNKQHQHDDAGDRVKEMQQVDGSWWQIEDVNPINQITNISQNNVQFAV